MMNYLIYELFSGVGFCNQLFSLETAIYLANISNRKLVLFIKYPLCHCGRASWNYGTIINFFSENYLQYLPNGIEIYYKTIPNDYNDIINNKEKTNKIKYGKNFSQLGFIDKNIFQSCNNDLNHPKIKNFLNYRKPIIFDISEWKHEYIYITESNASRCFYNFLTNSGNYQKMSNICESLTILHETFYELFHKIKLPNKYISLHFRFGDAKFSKEHIDRIAGNNYTHILNLLNNYEDLNKEIIVMCDRNDAEYLNTLKKSANYNITFSETYVENLDLNEYFENIKDYSVVYFLLQKFICEKADVFIGYEGSTVSNYINYINYISNKQCLHYTNKNIVIGNNYSWCLNGMPGGGIGWKLFFPDNIFINNLKIITLTNDGYKELTDNLLVSMKKIGIERLLKIYCIGDESYTYFKNKYYLNEVEQIDTEDKYLSNWIEYKAAQHKDTEGKKKWATITSYKIYVMNQELCKGNNIIFIDGDIVFEKDPFSYMLNSLEDDTELLIQNDQQVGMIPAMCTGFFWMKSNENTKKITNFETVTKNIDSFQNDQQYLRRFGKSMKHKYLDLDLFPNGKHYRDKNPKEPYIIHFNYDVSQHKIKRMKQFHKWYLNENNNEINYQTSKLISCNVNKNNSTNNNLKHKILDENSIFEFIREKNVQIRQGYITQVKEHSDLIIKNINKYCDVKNLKNILEIGFLAGHSAELFLKLNNNCYVTSVDECALQSVRAGKEYIDMHYPDRHLLIKGDSNKVLKDIIEENKKYDLILIDGSFKYDVVKEDIFFCKELIHTDSIVIINSVLENKKWIKYWNKEIVEVVEEMINNDEIEKLEQIDIDVGRGSLFCKFKNIN